MNRSNKTLDGLSICVSMLTNKAFLGKATKIKGMPDFVSMTGARRDVTHEVLDAASEIIGNNNKLDRPTVIEVGDIKYKLELIELEK
ncbi:hypothetical protein ID858_07930 [Xenorhabdus sp. DI]|uniref:DUF7446 family protein n=1 Tax=Xenorhabdus doucetiae TaxID=351671 RepID=UPI0019AB8DA2|nr:MULTISPECIES: hypothetical protein [unclassified Xenorhabdus]MBD2785412.1 hypothetical protein [Xenorhabdus sp. 3]MBD2788436.1 hypothetical protein [Xenorhabdus sp. DI]